MKDKFVLYPQDKKVFGIKFDESKEKVTIGGPVKSYQWMMMIITEIFQKMIPKPSFTAKNKIRYEVKCNRERFETCMGDLNKLGSFSVIKVRTFGRLMR